MDGRRLAAHIDIYQYISSPSLPPSHLPRRFSQAQFSRAPLTDLLLPQCTAAICPSVSLSVWSARSIWAAGWLGWVGERVRHEVVQMRVGVAGVAWAGLLRCINQGKQYGCDAEMQPFFRLLGPHHVAAS